MKNSNHLQALANPTVRITCLKRKQQLVALEEPSAGILVNRQGVVLVDNLASFADAILLSRSAALNRRVEQVHVCIQRKLTTKGRDADKGVEGRMRFSDKMFLAFLLGSL